jgi:hypothetical protein
MPRNVEFVTLTFDSTYAKVATFLCEHDGILNMLKFWLVDWRSCTPNLKRIVLQFAGISDFFTNWCSVLRDNVRMLDARTEVSLKVVCY